MDPVFVYLSFLFCLLLVISHRKYFQNWSEVEDDQKIWAIISIVMVIVTGLVSLLLLFGAFD